MKCYFLTIAIVLQGIFHNGGWIEINLQNKEEHKVMFCIPNRYYESPTDTHGHGTMIGYDLVGSETHIVYARTYNAELEIENWTDNQKIITDSKIVRKGIREGMYWRSDAFLKESGEIVFTLYGYGKDSLEINHILDSAHIDKANEQSFGEENTIEHQQIEFDSIMEDYTNAKGYYVGKYFSGDFNLTFTDSDTEEEQSLTGRRFRVITNKVGDNMIEQHEDDEFFHIN